MENSIEQSARGILRQLRAAEPNVQALAWVTHEGQVVTALFEQGNQDRIGAMSASLLALSAAASREVSLGALRQVILNGEEGTLLLTSAGQEHALLIAADTRINLGRLLVHAHRISGELAALEAQHPVQPA